MLSLVVQIVGSLAVLTGFALSQTGVLDPKSAVYLWLNAAGSGLLAADAVVEAQWGFLLLEGAWAIVSVAGLAHLANQERAFKGSRDSRPSLGQPKL
jgi:hypothetical protein